MNREKVKNRIKNIGIKKTFTPISDSPIEFRIAASKKLPGTVPVTVSNQSSPLFVYPETYLDIQNVLAVKKVKPPHEDKWFAEIQLNSQASLRLTALSEDIDLSVILFFKNYPFMNYFINQAIHGPAIIDAGPFNSEEVDIICDTINQARV